jgi:aspartyl-tRNA(Asn)/glutamyl-tRNA(Gln) amidotransferase subunit B
MEEGSLRCDANISVRRKGETNFGTKVEVKNMNSFRHVQKAIDHEIQRQIEIITSGGTVVTETRSFDAIKSVTFSMRSKETAQDYRYFPEPDLSPIVIPNEFMEKVSATVPELPATIFQRLMEEFKLTEYDAAQLTDQKEFSRFYLECCKFSNHYKSICNWLLVPVRNYLNENGIHLNELKLTPAQLAEIVNLVEDGKVNHSVAVQKLLPAVIQTQRKPSDLIIELDIVLQNNSEDLHRVIDEVLARFPDKIVEYKNGKKGILGLFVGEAMKATKGKSDPKIINQILIEKLNQ